MDVFRFTDKGISLNSFYSKKEAASEIHKIGEKYLSNVHESHKLTTDMDGVIVHDDSAIIASRIVAGPEAQEKYNQYADANIKAVVNEGQTSFCWHAPTMFVGQLLEGLSTEINRVIGRNTRLVPGAEIYICRLIDGLGYDVTAVTAGHQEAAEEVSKRAGIEKTIGTQLKNSNGIYIMEIKRFIGGIHKLKHVQKILGNGDGSYRGTHIGDSWSDVETLGGINNSIAFNPGCIYALRNARISAIGASKTGLIPFFDYKGKYDGEIREEQLPQTIIIMETAKNQEHAEQLLQESRNMKKKIIPKILNQDITDSMIEGRIKRELTRLGIDFQTETTSFMSSEEFDRYAKQAYLQLN